MPKFIIEPKEAILSNAKSIVVNEGFEQLTIRKVANAAGISIGTVYNYFPNKRDLSLQLMEEYWISFLIVIDEIDKQQTDFYKKMQQIYIQLESFVKTFKEVWIKNASGNHHDEDFMKKNDFFDKLNQKLEYILLNEQIKGTINLSTDTLTTAKFLMSNFFMMSMMNQFDYESFEKILKKLFM